MLVTLGLKRGGASLLPQVRHCFLVGEGLNHVPWELACKQGCTTGKGEWYDTLPLRLYMCRGRAGLADALMQRMGRRTASTWPCHLPGQCATPRRRGGCAAS